MTSKLEMTIAEVAKYPQFATDRLKYEKRVILESLQWRVDHPTAQSLSVRKDSILRYLIILIRTVRTVQCMFRAKFYDNKDDADYSKFWNEPALSKVFKDLDKTSNAITMRSNTICRWSFDCSSNTASATITNEISIDYNGLAFKGNEVNTLMI